MSKTDSTVPPISAEDTTDEIHRINSTSSAATVETTQLNSQENEEVGLSSTSSDPPKDLGIISASETVKETLQEGSGDVLKSESTSDFPMDKKDGRTSEEIKKDLSELLVFKERDPRKRKRCEDEKDDLSMVILLGVFLRSVYPLTEDMTKTITVGVFKSLNFIPALLLNQCGKTSIIFTIEMWDRFTKYLSIIEAYLYNNMTGRKTEIGFENSDIGIDNIRLRGTQYVRFRDLSKHNKKILLTFEEFQVLANSTPAINRYIQQLVTYQSVIFDYLNSSINTSPALPLIYGSIDSSIYNRLPQEVSFYRKTLHFLKKVKSDEISAMETELQEDITFKNNKLEDIPKDPIVKVEDNTN